MPRIPPCDLLVHCGDLTLEGREQELNDQFAWLAAAPASVKFVIAGNHDISFDRDYYARRGRDHHGGEGVLDEDGLDRIRKRWCGETAKASGIVFLDQEGVSTHNLRNGAQVNVYSSAFQPEFCDWAFGHPRQQNRFNMRGTDVDAEHPVPDFPAVDLVITHGPPHGVLDNTFDDVLAGCQHLSQAMQRARPLLHCFGHIHEGRGARRLAWETGKLAEIVPVLDQDSSCNFVDLTNPPIDWGAETVCINASIMDVHYRPVHPPWLMDVNLPVKT